MKHLTYINREPVTIILTEIDGVRLLATSCQRRTIYRRIARSLEVDINVIYSACYHFGMKGNLTDFAGLTPSEERVLLGLFMALATARAWKDRRLDAATQDINLLFSHRNLNTGRGLDVHILQV